MRLTQSEFNESFRQVFTIHLPVRWPHFTPLIRTLTTGHLHLGTVTMHRGFRTSTPSSPTPPRRAAPPPKTQHTAQKGGDTSMRVLQVAVKNPAPLPHLQVGPGLCLRHYMEQASDVTGTPVPHTDDGHPLCLSYHLKGVCNSNYGSRHAHRNLYSHKQGVLSARKSRFCAAQPPVSEI